MLIVLNGTTFEIVHDPVVSVKHKRITKLPSNRPCYAYFSRGKEDLDEIISTQMVGMAAGVFDIKGVELHTLFPSVQRIRLRPFFQEAWAKMSNKRQIDKWQTEIVYKFEHPNITLYRDAHNFVQSSWYVQPSLNPHSSEKM